MNKMYHRLGHYQLEESLGKGGQGEVYRAYDFFLDRIVAIKVLKEKVEPYTFEVIHNHAFEARTLVRLQHPNIINVIDFNIDDTTAYIVMEYAKNGSLRDIHPIGERVERDTILYYISQVTEALTFIHEAGIVHQDMKPENILLGDNDQVLVSDFGTASFLQPITHKTTSPFKVTVNYASPERYINSVVTPASDIYSLAVVVFEWLTGKPLFTGPASQVIWGHRFVKPSTKRMSALGIEPPIQQVLLKALAKNPKKRYQSAKEFNEALSKAFDRVKRRQRKWIGMSYISIIGALTSLVASLLLGLLNTRYTSFLLPCHLCLIIFLLIVALQRKNFIALYFVSASFVGASLTGLLFDHLFVFYFALPIFLFISAIIGLLKNYD